MNLLIITGDRSLPKKSAFYYTLEELSKHFDEITVTTPKGKPVVLFGNVFVSPSNLPLIFHPLFIYLHGRKLQKAIDIITVHTYPPFYNNIGAFFLKAPRKINEIHHLEAPAWMYRMFRNKRVVNKEVQKKIGGTVVHSIYLDIPRIEPQKKKYLVVSCGRLVQGKGFEDLARFYGSQALFVGDGPLKKKLESYGSTVTGWLETKEDVYRAMLSADGYWMYSKREGGPRAALEALALGMPVCSLKVGIMPEIMKDTGESYLRERGGAEQAQRIQAMFKKEDVIRRYAEFLKG